MVLRRLLASQFAFLALLALPVWAGAAVRYTVTDLGTLGGSESRAYGISNGGRVVGEADVGGGAHAFLYDGTMHDLGQIPGDDFAGPYLSYGYGINNAGRVVGSYFPAPDVFGAPSFPFLYDGAMHSLGILTGNGAPISHSAQGINNSGQIVGWGLGDDLVPHAFVYDGTLHDLNGVLGGLGSQAYAISDSGRVVGEAGTGAEGWLHAFLYDGTPHDLGVLPGAAYSSARAINSAGLVVGESGVTDMNTHAFLYDGAMHDLGTLGGTISHAYGVNDSGWVVGDAEMSGGGGRAFLYDGTAMVDLNSLIDPSSGYTLHRATAINNFGQIVGYGTNASGQTRAFVLDPVPEPSSASCLGLAITSFGGLVGFRRKRKGLPVILALVCLSAFLAAAALAQDTGDLDSDPGTGPGEMMGMTAVTATLPSDYTYLPTFPRFFWSYGCAPTSGAMIAGYYDNSGLPRMVRHADGSDYLCPTGDYPNDNADFLKPGDDADMFPSRCAIAATEAGVFGRASNNKGHVEDYVATTDWCDLTHVAEDPYYDPTKSPALQWDRHNKDSNQDGRDVDDCFADFMGANVRYFRGNTDANATVSFGYPNGGHYKFQPSRYPYNNQSSPYSGLDYEWGLARYVVEMAGYFCTTNHTTQTPYTYYNDVADYWNQNIRGYRTTCQDPPGCGVTPSDVKNEIDAGRPVIAIVTKLNHHTNPEYWYDPAAASKFHAFPVFGYKEDTNEITEYGPRLKLLCYDTWYEDSETGTSYRIVDFPTPSEAQCQFTTGATVSLIHYSACSDDSKWWRLIAFTFLHINNHDRCPDPLGENDCPNGIYPHAFDIHFDGLTDCSRVHYTFDGRDPNPGSESVPLTGGAGTLRVEGSCALKLRTYRDGDGSTDGYIASRVISRDYTLRPLKDFADDDPIDTGALVATTGTDQLGSGTCYVEDTDRVCGIRVQTSSTVSEGSFVSVSGTLGTNSDGERVITSATVHSLGTPANPITPLSMPNRSLGGGDWNYDSESGAGQQGVTDGVGLNNIGLLVRTTGCVCSYSTSSFEITDGSPEPITVITPSGVTPPDSGYVGATGVCSRQSDGNGGFRPVLLVRNGDDIVEYGDCECSAGGSRSNGPIRVRPEEPVVITTDMVAWALGQSDGTTVTLNACSVLDSSADGLAISDGWTTSAATIRVQGNWAINEWATVDVTGLVTTLAGGVRAIVATQILVYTDSRGRAFEFPVPFWRDPTGRLIGEWPYKETVSMRS